MGTTIKLSRCLHRCAAGRRFCWLPVLFVSVIANFIATVELHGEELNYTLIDRTTHMEPWPVEQPQFVPFALPAFQPPAPTSIEDHGRKAVSPHTVPTPTRPTSTRPTAKPRSTYEDKRPTPTTPPRSAPQSQTDVATTLTLSKPISAVEQERVQPEREATAYEARKLSQRQVPSVENKAGPAEVLVIPQAVENRAAPPENRSPATAISHCYQAPPLTTLSATIGLPAGKLPSSAAALCAAHSTPTGDARLSGAWAGTEFHWSATCLQHRPLYFEEINAERYGYTMSYFFQPVISAARFFATIPALPYKMAVDPPRTCIYTLGHYRPGSCAPRRWHRLPWQLTAGVVETGFIAGLILLIP